jgi:hypothetical protein
VTETIGSLFIAWTCWRFYCKESHGQFFVTVGVSHSFLNGSQVLGHESAGIVAKGYAYENNFISLLTSQ